MPVKKYPFTAGFFATLLFFLCVNILSVQLLSDCGLLGALNLAGCSDDISRAGFPLLVWEQGGFAYRQSFNPGALLTNLMIALGASVVVGVAVKWWINRPKNHQDKYSIDTEK